MHTAVAIAARTMINEFNRTGKVPAVPPAPEKKEPDCSPLWLVAAILIGASI